ncbi:MAG: hypothetical protein ACHQNA_13630, partial [Acidimicrobiales bacterium]
MIGQAAGGVFVTPVVTDQHGVRQVSVAAIIPGRGQIRSGTVVVTLSVDALIQAGLARIGSSGASVELVDGAGARLAAGGEPFPGNTASGDGATTSIIAAATVPVPTRVGYPAWFVVARQPVTPSAQAPVLLLVLLGVVMVLGGACVAGVWIVIRHVRRFAASSQQLAVRYEEVASQALVDVITGLGNQRGFQDECERQLE